MENYTDVNARTIDQWVIEGWQWGVPITHEAFENAKKGQWDIVLTPLRPVPHQWFAPFLKEERLAGVSVLGLASGGGQQMPILTALGANCTVLDYSDSQLESERLVAEREGYAIHTVKADMTQTFPFADESFDLIVHPVSNCYVEDVYHVWRECFRVLKKGGVLLAGMDNGFNFLFDSDTRPLTIVNKLPVNPLKDPAQMRKMRENNDGVQFSHTFDEQIGGQLEAGFLLAGGYEDFNSDPASLADGIPAYWATRAVKL